MSDMINPVIQEWVMTLKWKAQTGLISAIRGVDMIDVDPTDIDINNKCKTITKMIRYLVLNNADSRTNFMTDIIPTIEELVDVLNEIREQVSLGVVSNHWFTHIFLAIRIILDKHPNAYTRMYWLTVYIKYKTVPSDIEKVNLKEVEVSNTTIEDIKDIVSDIDSTEMQDIGYPIIGDKESDTISYGDKLATDYIKPTKSKKPKPVIESILDTKNEYPTIDDKSPVISDTIDREDYGIYQLEFERFIDGRDVTYNCINTDTSTQKIFRDMIKVLPQLDVILTGNWDVVNDTMSADYNLSIPISKGVEKMIKDTDTNRFMVANLTGELLYKDHLDQVWIIDSKLMSEDIIKVSVTRWIRAIDHIVYDLNPYKIHNIKIKPEDYYTSKES